MATGSNSFGSSQSANGSEERSILLDMPRRSDQPCDITLMVKDDKEIKASGNVLREASSFVKNILDGDWNESREGIIRLEFLTEEVMKDILELIYSGSVEICSMERAQDLIAAADFLLLSSRLKDIPEQFCEQNLSNSNCISVYQYAERYRCEKLLAKTTEFIYSNFAPVANAEEFLNLSSHEVEQWISSDDINISAEDDVFRIILKWIDHDKNERKKNFQDLFRHVRLSFVSRDCLLNEVSTNELVKHNDTCLNVVMSILNRITGSTTDEDLFLRYPAVRSLFDEDLVTPPTTDGDLSLKFPRNVFQSEVLVTPGTNEKALLYLPDDGEWYELPGLSRSSPLMSFENKLFFFESFSRRYWRCYDAFLNYSTIELDLWADEQAKKEKLNSCDVKSLKGTAVEDGCLVVSQIRKERFRRTWYQMALFKYKLDSGSCDMISTLDMGRRTHACFVFVDKYLYTIGGIEHYRGMPSHVVDYAARFDIIEKKWEYIADIQEERYDACGVSVGDRIFIAGGIGRYMDYSTIKTSCEMYNILTNQWQFIASLKIPRHLATMVCVDGMLYVVGGWPSDMATDRTISMIVECYDRERNEWKQKTIVPAPHCYSMDSCRDACSLRIFKGILRNLQPLQQPEAIQRQLAEPISDSFAAPVENTVKRTKKCRCCSLM